ncbi:MAG: UDP-Glc:alpha-D-GlcNAc-diphosphoundecaprenol beta-1,3-glucosyltransferase WfgD [Candidatus Omnitrophica bacterium ADurb.Bin277]|nr:MAG: UDP-Glc:alpha-D-GlcNAc-diphosphoundecaprenol beta-1,3-glucosyltransferase WfgD [Candidatus Omnitrophica bacterium ADurb.Bin277]
MDPLVSVIIPVYNRSAVLPRAIRSVLSQTGVPLELIVVDDGSTDDVEDAVRATGNPFPEIRLIPRRLESRVPDPGVRTLRQENQGPSAARNLGIKHSKGEWIAFLDSDDEWLPGKLKAQTDFFRKNPDCLICQTEEIWIRNGKRVNPMKKHKKYGGYIFEKCLPLCIVSPSAVMMHRKLFDEIGIFDESLPACEDYDLWLRIAARHPIGLIKKPYIIKYGGHADQRSREFPAMDLFRIRSLAKLLGSGILTAEQTSAARRMLEEKSRIFIQGALKRGKEKEAAAVQNLLGMHKKAIVNSNIQPRPEMAD